MIIIKNKLDLQKCYEHNVEPLIIEYLNRQLEFCFRGCDCTDIGDFGALCLLENLQDCKNYKGIGVFAPLTKERFEFTENITIKGLNTQTQVLHSCFAISDGYAISVFMPSGTIDNETKEYLSKNIHNKEVHFNV